MSLDRIDINWSDFLDTKTKICGIVNLTPDSFSDGGLIDETTIQDRVDNLISQGANIIDVGAESTRPGAQEISSNEQLNRIAPVIDCVSKYDDVLFSIDTRNHEVASFALENGFHIVNDVSGGTFDSQMNETVAKNNALYIIMHSRGTPESMSELNSYENIVEEVASELQSRIDEATNSLVSPKKIMVDPGIGFAKTAQDNILLMDNLDVLKKMLGYPMMVGVSRKSVVSYLLSGDTTSAPMDERDDLSAELSVRFAKMGIDVVRVHNVVKTKNELQKSNF